jgi:hypothetical protein
MGSEAAHLQAMVAHLKRRGQQTDGTGQPSQSLLGNKAPTSAHATTNAHSSSLIDGAAPGRDNGKNTVGGVGGQKKKRKEKPVGVVADLMKKRKGHLLMSGVGDGLRLGKKQMGKAGVDGSAKREKDGLLRVEKKARKKKLRHLDAER